MPRLEAKLGRKVAIGDIDVSLGHAVWLNDEEIRICAATGTSVCHNPSSNLRLRVGILPAPRLLELGVNLSMGIDGTGINDDEERLASLLRAAREAGAANVSAQPLFLKGSSPRRHFFAWLDREFPALAPLYRRLYGRRDYLDEAAKERLLATFRRLRLEAGFPRPLPSRA